MKVLSIIEPWATLIKTQNKLIETRSFKTKYRGELYIHASLKKIKVTDEIQNILNLIPGEEMSYGHIICKCNLVDCVYMDDEFIKEIKKNKREYICGDYSVGRYAWILENVEVIEKIPAKGKLGIWNFDIID